MRVNKTEKNLQKVWKKLDDAYGLLESAFEMLYSMSKLPDNIRDGIEVIDLTAISGLKCDIEMLMERKE